MVFHNGGWFEKEEQKAEVFRCFPLRENNEFKIEMQRDPHKVLTLNFRTLSSGWIGKKHWKSNAFP